VGEIIVSFDDHGTDFIGGTYRDIRLNKKVKVEGGLVVDVDGNRVLKAAKVTFLIANITSHIANNYGKMTASSSPEIFSWSGDGLDAKAYRLQIYQEGNEECYAEGDAECLDNIFYDEIFAGDVTSIPINSGLPDNAASFGVNLYTLHGVIWSKKHIGFMAQEQY
jgi:hypothetical protein